MAKAGKPGHKKGSGFDSKSEHGAAMADMRESGTLKYKGGKGKKSASKSKSKAKGKKK